MYNLGWIDVQDCTVYGKVAGSFMTETVNEGFDISDTEVVMLTFA